jgi:hypothetical protein
LSVSLQVCPIKSCCPIKYYKSLFKEQHEKVSWFVVSYYVVKIQEIPNKFAAPFQITFIVYLVFSRGITSANFLESISKHISSFVSGM